MEKKLYKSSNDKVLAGVCGGIGEYFEMDPVFVRLIWVLATLVYGAGFVLYVIAAVIMPERNSDSLLDKHNTYRKHDREGGRRILGMIFVGLGLFFIIKRYVYWLDMESMVAIGFIIFGIYIFMKNRGKKNEE